MDRFLTDVPGLSSTLGHHIDVAGYGIDDLRASPPSWAPTSAVASQGDDLWNDNDERWPQQVAGASPAWSPRQS